MRVFSLVTRTEIEASPIVDGQNGKLMGFQEKTNGPIWPVELFKIPFAPDWESVRVETMLAVLPGVASRCMNTVQNNARISQTTYPTEEAIVEEACRIADAIVKHLQDSQSSVFSQGAEAIRKERIRQISGEGYNSEHDNQHDPKEFLLAAVSYLLDAIGNEKPEDYWPFDSEYYKPKDFVRDAERAGALIAAGLDRYYRQQKESKSNDKKDKK